MAARSTPDGQAAMPSCVLEIHPRWSVGIEADCRDAIMDGAAPNPRWTIVESGMDESPCQRGRSLDDLDATNSVAIGFWAMMRSMTIGTIAFETAMGRCGVGWSEAGITAVLLPGARGIPDQTATDDTDLPAFVRRAIEGMRAVLAGTADDLLDVPVDHRGIDDFRQAVYEATRRIAPGTTRSYGEVARAIARLDAARDVGVALSRNPTPIIVPCHRVVAASGALTGFSAPGGLATKRRMLELEGAPGYGQLQLFG